MKHIECVCKYREIFSVSVFVDIISSVVYLCLLTHVICCSSLVINKASLAHIIILSLQASLSLSGRVERVYAVAGVVHCARTNKCRYGRRLLEIADALTFRVEQWPEGNDTVLCSLLNRSAHRCL